MFVWVWLIIGAGMIAWEVGKRTGEPVVVLGLVLALFVLPGLAFFFGLV